MNTYLLLAETIFFLLLAGDYLGQSLRLRSWKNGVIGIALSLLGTYFLLALVGSVVGQITLKFTGIAV